MRRLEFIPIKLHNFDDEWERWWHADISRLESVEDLERKPKRKSQPDAASPVSRSPTPINKIAVSIHAVYSV